MVGDTIWLSNYAGLAQGISTDCLQSLGGLPAQDQGKVQKIYIARVLGCFPAEAVTVDKHLAWDSRSNHAFLMDPDGSLAEKQSLGSVPLPSQSQQLRAKEAQTSFRRLSIAPDGRTSLVECLLQTGRTHQIRYLFSH